MAKAKTLIKLSDTELMAPLPKMELAGPQTVKYDFAAQKEFLEQRISQVLSEDITEKNLERIRVLKKGVVSWRTSFQGEVDNYLKTYYKAPMGVFKAAASEVLSDIDSLESKLDEVLEREEEKRIDNVNAILDGIEEDLQEQFNLPEEYKNRIERKKAFYNKTAVMADVAKDLKEQYTTQSKLYKAYTSAVKLVTNACKGDKRLNLDMYIHHLDYAELSDVLDEIETERARLTRIDEDEGREPAVKETEEEKPVMTVGIKVDQEKLKSDFPGITKKMTLEITYPVDSADELSRIFTEIRKGGVKMRVISVVDNVSDMPVF